MKRIVSFVLCLILFFGVGMVFASEVVAKVWINEFSSSDAHDWVELYNDSGTEVLLTEYRLRDNSASNKLDLVGSIQPKGFTVFDWSDRLNNSGDSIRLVKKSDESQIEDSVTYGNHDGKMVDAPAAGQIAARLSDGAGEFALFALDSKGLTNGNAPPVPTATPFPTETPKPTQTPKPTATPTKSPTPGKSLIPTKTPTQPPSKSPTNTTNIAGTNKSLAAGTVSPTPDHTVPTAVLGYNTEPTPFSMPTKEVATDRIQTLGISGVNPAIILISSGVVAFLICAILVFLRYKKLR